MRGIYSVSGDLGKIARPAAIGLASALLRWRTASAASGVVDLLVAGAMLLVLTRLGVGARPSPGTRPVS